MASFPALGRTRSASAVITVTSLSGASKPIPGRETSLTTMASRRLRAQLLARVGQRAVPVFGREADNHLVVAPALGQSR